MPSILYESPAPHVARITLNRPEALNALDFAAVEAFGAAVERAHADPDLHALILTGAGDRAFCAGGDLRELAGYVTEADARLVSAGMTAVLSRLEALPVPTIAALNGLSRGGGTETSLACDLRLMADTATMGWTQIGLAVTPGWGGGQRLLRLVGYSRAMELLLEGKVLAPPEALAHGLVNRVVPFSLLQAEALAWAVRIASRPPRTARAVKQILQAGLRLAPADAERFEADVFPPLWASPEHHALVAAFLNRQKE